MIKYILFVLSFTVSLLFGSVKNVQASEGIILMRSLTKENHKCYATSILMQDANYLISVACRNVKYPPNDSILYYILWATPANGGNPIKLTEIDLGRVYVKTRVPFKNMFVTIESDPKTKLPTGKIVMRGDVEKISFLESFNEEEVTPTKNQEVKNSPTTQQTNIIKEETNPKDKLFIAVQRAGVAAAIVLVILVGVIFAVSRAKG